MLHGVRKVHGDVSGAFGEDDFNGEVFSDNFSELVRKLGSENICVVSIVSVFDVVFRWKGVTLIPRSFPASHNRESWLDLKVDLVSISEGVWGRDVAYCVDIVQAVSELGEDALKIIQGVNCFLFIVVYSAKFSRESCYFISDFIELIDVNIVPVRDGDGSSNVFENRNRSVVSSVNVDRVRSERFHILIRAVFDCLWLVVAFLKRFIGNDLREGWELEGRFHTESLVECLVVCIIENSNSRNIVDFHGFGERGFSMSIDLCYNQLGFDSWSNRCIKSYWVGKESFFEGFLEWGKCEWVWVFLLNF